jgi:hypothetical protein
MPKSSLYGKPKQLQRAGERIARGLEDVASGRSSGEYPALESLLGKRPDDTNTICTPDCVHRGGPELIRDVRPPLTERMAVMEHMATDIKEKFEDHRAESIRATATFATKEELLVIDKHVDKLDTQNTAKTVVLVFTILGLLFSMAYNGINIYRNLHL